MPFPYLRTNVHTQGQTQQTHSINAKRQPKKPVPLGGVRRITQLNSCTEKLCQQIFIYVASLSPSDAGRSLRSLGLRAIRRGGHLALPQPQRGFGGSVLGDKGRQRRPCFQRQQATRLALRQTKTTNQRSVGNFQQSTKLKANRQKPKTYSQSQNSKAAIAAKSWWSQQATRLAMRHKTSQNPFASGERVLVEPDGIEPTTCSLQSYRSPN